MGEINKNNKIVNKIHKHGKCKSNKGEKKTKKGKEDDDDDDWSTLLRESFDVVGGEGQFAQHRVLVLLRASDTHHHEVTHTPSTTIDTDTVTQVIQVACTRHVVL